MAGKNPDYAWMNGEVIPWEKAVIHVRTDAVMYGANVFEGIRAYSSPDKQQLYIFKNREHMDRLFNSSMKILRMQTKWTPEDLTRGMIDVMRANRSHEDIHIRPTFYFGAGEAYAFDPAKIEVGSVVTTQERPAKASLFQGINVCVSSWRRISDDVVPPRVKGGGQLPEQPLRPDGGEE